MGGGDGECGQEEGGNGKGDFYTFGGGRMWGRVDRKEGRNGEGGFHRWNA